MQTIEVLGPVGSMKSSVFELLSSFVILWYERKLFIIIIITNKEDY